MAPVRQTTAVRFCLRGLLIGVAVVAMLCGAVAPSFRDWNLRQRVAFLVVFGSALLALSGTMGLCSMLRLRVERRAGPVHLSLNVHQTQGLLFLWAIADAVLVAPVFALAFEAAHWEGFRHVAAATPIIATGFRPYLRFALGILAGATAGFFATPIWWRADRVDVCDRGVLTFLNWYPWPAVTYEWPKNDSQLLTLSIGRRRIPVVIPDESRAELNEILTRRPSA